MAFNLKSMLGHMMRPSQQAAAIATNNTDQLLLHAVSNMAPASPTLQAQSKRLAAVSSEVSPLRQTPPSEDNKSARQQRIASRSPVTPARCTTPPANPFLTETNQSHQNAQQLYALPNLMTVQGQRYLPGSVYTTKLPTPTMPQTNKAGHHQGAPSAFYLPPSATDMPQPHNFQQSVSQQVHNHQGAPSMTTIGPSYSNAHHQFMTGHRPITNHRHQSYHDANQVAPFEPSSYHTNQAGLYAPFDFGQQNYQHPSGQPFGNFQKPMNHNPSYRQRPLYNRQEEQLSQQQPTPSGGKRNQARKGPGAGGRSNNLGTQAASKSHKIEQQYFKNEAEAQAWEDLCLDENFEAPAPKQFLQSVTSSKPAKAVNSAPGPCAKKNGAKNVKNQVAQAQKGGDTLLSGANQISANPPTQQNPTEPQQSFKMKFKTEICKFWQLNGTCEYSESCSFAHGAHELKQRTDQPRNYKTKQCKRYHKELYCPYGPRCQFLHDEPPMAKKKKAPTVSASTTNAAVQTKKEDDKKAEVSYLRLLNTVGESLADQSSDATAAAMPIYETEVLAQKPVEKVPEIAGSSSRRLQVFTDIHSSLNDSQLSIE